MSCWESISKGTGLLIQEGIQIAKTENVDDLLHNNNNANYNYTQFYHIRLEEFPKFYQITVGKIIGK